MNDDRLYGLVYAEHLQDDPDDVWELWRDCHEPADWEAPGWCLTIEEWSVAPTSKMLPAADLAIESLVERFCEDTTEEHYESISKISQDPAVVERFRFALDFFGAALDAEGYRMADKLLAEHKVTFVDGKFHFDGEPTDWRVSLEEIF